MNSIPSAYVLINKRNVAGVRYERPFSDKRGRLSVMSNYGRIALLVSMSEAGEDELRNQYNLIIKWLDDFSAKETYEIVDSIHTYLSE